MSRAAVVFGGRGMLCPRCPASPGSLGRRLPSLISGPTSTAGRRERASVGQPGRPAVADRTLHRSAADCQGGSRPRRPTIVSPGSDPTCSRADGEPPRSADTRCRVRPVERRIDGWKIPDGLALLAELLRTHGEHVHRYLLTTNIDPFTKFNARTGTGHATGVRSELLNSWPAGSRPSTGCSFMVAGHERKPSPIEPVAVARPPTTGRTGSRPSARQPSARPRV